MAKTTTAITPVVGTPEPVQAEAGAALAHQLLGQAQMARAFSQFSRTIGASKLQYVKENKLYQQLKGFAAPNGSVLNGTWEDYCGLLGMSADKADADIANLKAFGEEALESMSRMGIGYRELRQYRRLPDDERQALIEIAQAGDKEGFLDLAETIIARHAKDRAEKDERIAELESALTDRTVQCDKAETEVMTLRKQSERGASEDSIPLVIADMRAEAMVLAKQASLAVESHGPLAEQIARLKALDGEGPMWVDGTVRLVLSGLAAQRMLVEAQIARWLALLPEEESNPLPDAFSYLSPTEIQSLAREWPKLTAVHEHGKALREWEREQARPRGKGRPSAKPQAPKA